MLLYASVGISELEIPTKQSLVIYISNCQHKCKNCHTPYLHDSFGDSLKDNFQTIFNIYYNYFDVVCFMGEGKESIKEKDEMIKYCKFIHDNKKQVALYCGRDCYIESWMKCLLCKNRILSRRKRADSKKTSNQKLFKKENNKYKDITYMFWK